jgi:NADPH2:quinone reductase
MLAAWYEKAGPAADVLQVGELPDPVPGAGEVRVRVHVSGVNPGDTKKRGDWQALGLPFPRIVPHSDGAGVIDAVGPGVDPGRTGGRVWVFGAQSYRAGGTAAQYCVVPEHLAVPLPDAVDYETGACLGIPGITAHRCVFADGSVDGATVLVHGVLGGVASLAARLARWGGARVIGTVRRGADLTAVAHDTADHLLPLDQDDPVSAVKELAPNGVDRIIEVSLSDNADLDCAVAANGAVIAAYATREARPDIPFWNLLFSNVMLRMLGSDDFPDPARRQAVRDLTATAAAGLLHPAIAARYPLSEIAAAHDHVDAGTRGRILLTLP